MTGIMKGQGEERNSSIACLARLLVVDDESAIRSLLGKILRSAGHTVHEAPDVATAKEILASETIDLLITDLNMPGESGLDLISHVKSSSIDIGVVVATVIDNPVEASKILETGVYGYIVKPFSANLVLITVANALRRHQLETETVASRRELESRLKSITENLHVGLLLVDATRRLLEINRQARLWFPGTMDSLVFLDEQCLSSEPNRSCSSCILQVLADGRRMHFRARFDTQSGLRDFEVTLLPVVEDGHEPSAIIVMMQDLTEQLSLERELRQAQKLEAIGQLAAGIAHEINTPVQYLGDNIRFLNESFQEISSFFTNLDAFMNLEQQSGNLPPGYRERLDKIMNDLDLEFLLEELPPTISQSQEGIERIGSIIRAMKEFSHPGSTEMAPTDINHCLQSTLTVSRNEWKYAADVETDLAEKLPLIPCLVGEVNQVFLNLIVNAAHAIQSSIDKGRYARGTISIATRLDINWLVITVTDNGCGIPTAIQHRVFDPFFTTKTIGKGTGQGLSIARNIIVDKHNGSLRFTTALNEGTTFTIRLPIRQNANGGNAEQAAKP